MAEKLYRITFYCTTNFVMIAGFLFLSSDVCFLKFSAQGMSHNQNDCKRRWMNSSCPTAYALFDTIEKHTGRFATLVVLL